MRSFLLVWKAARGKKRRELALSCQAWRSTAWVWMQTPSTASTTTSAPSLRRAAVLTSLQKSTCPGESMRLIRCPAQHSNGCDMQSRWPCSPGQATRASSQGQTARATPRSPDILRATTSLAHGALGSQGHVTVWLVAHLGISWPTIGRNHQCGRGVQGVSVFLYAAVSGCLLWHGGQLASLVHFLGFPPASGS